MRISFISALVRVCPPWLQRSVGARLMGSLGEPLETLVERTADSVSARFPRPTSDTEALAVIGRERRILRGPGETAGSYSSRLLRWWDAHRGRGTPYELLLQLRAYLSAIHPGARIDVVYHSGTRRWSDATGAVTRDAIEWNGDGSNRWAQVWIFIHTAEPVLVALPLLTDDGEVILTDDGDPILAELPASSSGAMPLEYVERYVAVPREWSAAHVQRTHVVLLYGTARLVGYPEGRLVGEPGMTVRPPDAPVVMTIEEH